MVNEFGQCSFISWPARPVGERAGWAGGGVRVLAAGDLMTKCEQHFGSTFAAL